MSCPLVRSAAFLVLVCWVAAFAHRQAEKYMAIASGGRFTCARSSEGRLFCWGWNGDGELGNGSTNLSRVPSAVHTAVRFRFHAAGDHHTCALDSLGAAYCWGSNSSGQLGIGSHDVAPHSLPAPVHPTTHFRTLAAGSNHTCGIGETGELYCWGNNKEGQLGTGDTVPSDLPTRVVGSPRFSSVSAEHNITCGLTTTGDAYCWGEGAVGAKEHPSGWTTDYGTCNDYCVAIPLPLPTKLRFTVLAPSYCGLSGGTAYCWNPERENYKWPPKPVSPGLHFTSLAGNNTHYCGLTARGTAYCWATGGYFDSDLRPPGAPGWERITRRVARPAAFSVLAPGASHICGLSPSGDAYCWGHNQDGQLGTGNAESASAPLRVASPP